MREDVKVKERKANSQRGEREKKERRCKEIEEEQRNQVVGPGAGVTQDDLPALLAHLAVVLVLCMGKRFRKE